MMYLAAWNTHTFKIGKHYTVEYWSNKEIHRCIEHFGEKVFCFPCCGAMHSDTFCVVHYFNILKEIKI